MAETFRRSKKAAGVSDSRGRRGRRNSPVPMVLALNQKQINDFSFFALLFVLLVSFDDIVVVKTQLHFGVFVSSWTERGTHCLILVVFKELKHLGPASSDESTNEET